MKLKSILTFMTAIALLVTMTGCDSKTKAEAITSETIIMTVNDEEIKASEAILVLRNIQSLYETYYNVTDWDIEVEEGVTIEDKAKEGAIDYLTRLVILEKVAADKGVTLSEEKKAEVDEAASSFFESLNQNDIEQYGITSELVKKQLYSNALSEELFNQEMADFKPDEEKLEQELQKSEEYLKVQEQGYEEFLKKARVRHILISTLDENQQPLEGEALEEKEALAKDVLDKLKAGEDFVELVGQYSEDPGSKDSGGEYMVAKTGTNRMVPEFEEASFSVEPGQLSDLVKTQYGYHIIKVEEIIQPEETEIEQFKQYIQQMKDYAIDIQKQEAFNALYEGWKESYTIEVKDNVLANIGILRVQEEDTQDNESNGEQEESNEGTGTENSEEPEANTTSDEETESAEETEGETTQE